MRGPSSPHILFFATLLSIALLIEPTAIIRAQTTATPSTPAEAITPQTIAAYFDQTLAQQMADEHIVGASVAVVKDDQLLFAKGYGYADLSQQRPVVADETLFYPGSTGKLLTWIAVMQLVEQGKLDLHTNINTYLDFTIPATFPEPITLAHLLTHTAGFAEQLAALQVAKQADVLPLDTFVKTRLPARVYMPGSTFAYSNYATALAGYIVARVTGVPYEQYITDQILAPLAMTHSAAVQPLPPPMLANLAQGYHYRNDQYTAVDFEWIAAAPAAPLRTTATDMAKFMLAQLNHCQAGQARLLQKTTCTAMQRMQFAHDPHVNGVGYGFMISVQNGKTLVWHTGGSAHFNTMLALIPEERVGFFISYNTPVVDVYQPLVRFVDHFYPAAPTPTVSAPVDSAQRIAALSGAYVSSRVAHQSVQKWPTWYAEGLTVQPGVNNTLQVGARTYTETEPGIFHQIDGPRVLTYRTNAQGEVTQLFWGQFTYFKIPWVQAAGFQILVAVGALLVLWTAALAWLVDGLVGWWRKRERSSSWAAVARWAVVGLGLYNSLLLSWFLVALLGYADTYVFPTATMRLLTQLWWLNGPAVAALLGFTLLAWRQPDWRLAWRIHYTVVTGASLVFLAFLLNWHLLAGL